MNSKGVVKISKDVLLNIIGLATLDIDGVVKVCGFVPDTKFQDYLYNENKGIKLDVIENKLYINLSIITEQGYDLPKLCLDVQNNIEKEVKSMTGLRAEEINIEVIDLV